MKPPATSWRNSWKHTDKQTSGGRKTPDHINFNRKDNMDIYKFMREIGEDTVEMDMCTDDLLDELDMDETDFYF